MVDHRFNPKSIDIAAGTTVTWVIAGFSNHDVASRAAGFRSGAISRGERFSFTFNEPGTYGVICRLHAIAGMSSTVVVT